MSEADKVSALMKPMSPSKDAIGPAIMEMIRVDERSSMARATRNSKPGAAATVLAQHERVGLDK